MITVPSIQYILYCTTIVYVRGVGTTDIVTSPGEEDVTGSSARQSGATVRTHQGPASNTGQCLSGDPALASF
jgi:hypothetical protein